MTEMPASRFDAEARFAQVEERVTNISSRLTSLEQSTSQGFAGAAAQINTLSSEMRSSIAGIAAEIRAGQKTPWSTIWTALGVLFTALVGVGWLAYAPIQESVGELKTEQRETLQSFIALNQSLPKTFLSNDLAQILRDRDAEDRKGMTGEIAALRDKIERLQAKQAP